MEITEIIGWVFLFVIPLLAVIVALVSSLARWLGSKGWSYERWLDSRSFVWVMIIVLGILPLVVAGGGAFVAYVLVAVFFQLFWPEKNDEFCRCRCRR